MAERLTLEVDVPLHVATLRYFDAAGAFAAALTLAAGVPLPGPVAAAVGRSVTLAWLGPRETLALCADDARLEELAAQLAEVPGGQLVDLRGGLTALRLAGTGVAEFLSRLGGFGTVPAPGEARRGRLADVPVLALSLRAGQIQLVADRACAAHLLEWIRCTLGDFARQC
jgi:heterotetrameric sarcosine oxidase gamma subunit